MGNPQARQDTHALVSRSGVSAEVSELPIETFGSLSLENSPSTSSSEPYHLPNSEPPAFSPLFSDDPNIIPLDFSPYYNSLDRVLGEVSLLPAHAQLDEVDDIILLLQGTMIDIYEQVMSSRVQLTLFSATQTTIRITRRLYAIDCEEMWYGVLGGESESLELASVPSYLVAVLMGLLTLLQGTGGAMAAREKGLDEEIFELLKLRRSMEADVWEGYRDCYDLINDRPELLPPM